jgi:hypothetical protein
VSCFTDFTVVLSLKSATTGESTGNILGFAGSLSNSKIALDVVENAGAWIYSGKQHFVFWTPYFKLLVNTC